MLQPEQQIKSPSQEIRDGLNELLSQSGELQRFADAHNFKFGSLYKIAKGQIEQPGVDYGCQILAALKRPTEG